MTDDSKHATAVAGPALSEGLGPTRQQVNAWMADAGWQNSAIRQADLDKVERVVRVAVAAERQRLQSGRDELVAAWNDLPDALRCHPGLKRLYAAAQRA